MSERVLAVADVTKTFEEGSQRVEVLRGISLAVAGGEVVALEGPSGSGKTTLLSIMGCILTPSSGSVEVAGRRVDGRPHALREVRRRSIGFVFQQYNLFPALTALENVEFGVDVTGRHRDARPIATRTLARVGLGERLHHFPHELSGGEQQRVAIARAVATGNPVLLADEPTGELDFRTGVQILELLHEQTHEARTSVLVVTHNREIARIAHRVIELSSGQVVSDGPPEGGRAEISDLHW
jgi:putative ABC transport system ATP-binding protein